MSVSDRELRSRPALPYIVLFAGVCAVGSAALMARAALDAGTGPLALSAWRLTIASVLLVGICSLRRQDGIQRLDRASAVRLTAAGVCLGLHFALWFASLRLIPVARSTLLVTTAPLWAGLAGWLLLRRHIPRRFWWGLLIAGIGTLVIVNSGSKVNVVGRGAWAGDLLAVLGAVMVAGYLLLVEDLQTSLGTRRVVAWTYSAAAISLWPIVLVSGEVIVPHEPAAWMGILGLALVPQLIGHTALNWSLRWFSAGAVSAATLLEPVFAGLLAWWLLAEPIMATQAVGAVVLLAGVALAVKNGNADGTIGGPAPGP